MECVISVKAIKYIYKYVYKGHDRTTMEFGKSQDEIKLYLDARYVSACEGFWCIIQSIMHQELPHIICLQVHLEGQHLVSWKENDDAPPGNYQPGWQQGYHSHRILHIYFPNHSSSYLDSKFILSYIAGEQAARQYSEGFLPEDLEALIGPF
jgi:hypothetical protein